MKVIKINSSFIRPHTIKSFSVYAEQEFIVLKIFNGVNYIQDFEIFKSKELDYHYTFGVKQNSKTVMILDEIDNLMQKLAVNTSLEVKRLLSKRKGSIFKNGTIFLDYELFNFLQKSEEKNNIELLVKEYRKEQRKIGFFKRFFL
ncbi:hypothetical protein JTQ25_001552 [Campylobacter coli]|nr:hypothetical protein [Campylobacter coli]EJM3591132.1 hypothetical protein [Campylobacter coli]ELU1112272.1 hypothetical protein [Campylobacter coli]